MEIHARTTKWSKGVYVDSHHCCVFRD